jgi:hypothetical protein
MLGAFTGVPSANPGADCVHQALVPPGTQAALRSFMSTSMLQADAPGRQLSLVLSGIAKAGALVSRTAQRLPS